MCCPTVVCRDCLIVGALWIPQGCRAPLLSPSTPWFSRRPRVSPPISPPDIPTTPHPGSPHRPTGRPTTPHRHAKSAPISHFGALMSFWTRLSAARTRGRSRHAPPHFSSLTCINSCLRRLQGVEGVESGGKWGTVAALGETDRNGSLRGQEVSTCRPFDLSAPTHPSWTTKGD